MLLANYASDSGSDSDEDGPISTAVPAPSPAAAAGSSKATSGAGKPVKKKGPVKITLDLPKPSSTAGREVDNDDEEGGSGRRSRSRSPNVADRDGKRIKLGSKGKGSSALLGMLPAPKRKLPVKTESKGNGLAVNKSMAAKPSRPIAPPGMEDLDIGALAGAGGDEDDAPASGSGLLLPSSMARARAKKEKEEESAAEIDLFGLSAASSNTAAAGSSSKATTSTSAPPNITSAPTVPDFVPPEPTLDDPYPGYYQLPSGDWAAHDKEYYHSFWANAAKQGQPLAGETRDDGRVGRHWDEYNTRGADLVDVDVGKGLQEGRAEQERLEQLKKPKTGDSFEYKTMGKTKGLAAQRHQLTSLLSSAYTQKEELEDRIAQNSKNMRIARQKYGF